MLTADQLDEIIKPVTEAKEEFSAHYDLDGSGRDYHITTEALQNKVFMRTQVALVELVSALKADLTKN